MKYRFVGYAFIDTYGVKWKSIRYWHKIPILWSVEYGEGLYDNGKGLKII
jgi:hypothetical protein